MSIVLVTLLMVSGLAAFPGELAARNRITMSLPAKVQQLKNGDLSSNWSRLSVDDKRMLAAYVLYFGLKNTGMRSRVRKIFGREKDEVLRAYDQVAGAYYESADYARRENRLSRAYRARSASAYRGVIDFYRRLASRIAGRRVRALELAPVCKLPGHAVFCRLVRMEARLDELSAGKKLSGALLKSVLTLGKPFLSRRPIEAPFYAELGRRLPAGLYSLGLPLEAAIMADRMSRGREGNRTIKSTVPFYLAAAADFNTAIKYASTVKYSDSRAMLNARVDWMILAGRYRDAINLIIKSDPGRMSGGSLRNYRDYWTSFRYGADVIRLRLALLFYLAGDAKKAVSGLKRLQFSGKTINGEPEKYFARLRLAQIMLRDNPRLSHKIAEDISYVAQANNWWVLEYHATLLDGWALYYLKKNYKSLISFTKAGGILKGENKKYGAEYSRLLGKLSAKTRMHRSGNYSGLIRQINALLRRRPYNEAIYTIREWAPMGAGPEFFLRVAMRNQQARGDQWGSLNLLLEFSRADEHFFSPGKNPGGVRGSVMSVQWSREMERFTYYKSLFPSGRMRGETSEPALGYAAARLPRMNARGISAKSFKTGDAHLFSFPANGGRLIYLVYPSSFTKTKFVNVRLSKKQRRRLKTKRKYKTVKKVSRSRGWGISYVYLNRKDADSLLRTCSRPGPDADFCQTNSDSARKLQGLVRRAAGKNNRLRIQYIPEFDINYRGLIAASRAGVKAKFVYFYSHYTGRQERSAPTHTKIFRGRGCVSTLSRALGASPRDFEGAFSGERTHPGQVWIWPEQLDARTTSRGKPRPVYLRNFVCGKDSLRFWEMDRFAPRGGPHLIVYRRRGEEPEMNRAFARHFAERGTVLLEVGDSRSYDRAIRILRTLKENPARLTPSTISRAFEKGAPGDGSLRLILPNVSD